MPELTPAMLADILGTVLEDTAFMLVEPIEVPTAWEGPALRATLDFESVRSGRLRLTLDEPAGVELSSSMLGTDPADPEAVGNGRAAVSEILNVVGGVFLTRFFGSKVPSQLGLPSTMTVDPGAAAPPPATCAAAIRTEGGHAMVLELELG
jgi:hypothetical protein